MVAEMQRHSRWVVAWQYFLESRPGNFPGSNIEAAVDKLSKRVVRSERYEEGKLKTDAEGIFRGDGPTQCRQMDLRPLDRRQVRRAKSEKVLRLETEAVAILKGLNEGLDHLSVYEVAAKLIQFPEPEVIPLETSIWRLVRIPSQIPKILK